MSWPSAPARSAAVGDSPGACIVTYAHMFPPSGGCDRTVRESACFWIRVSLLIVVAEPDDQRFDPAHLHQSMFYSLYSMEYKPFFSEMNIGMMLTASTAVQASSLLLKKAVSTFKRS